MEFLIKNYRNVYFFTLTLGFLFILIFSTSTFLLGINESTKLKAFLTLVLISLMGFLGFLIYKKSTTIYINVNDPDYFYYLGFIFTIGSLIAGFLPIAFGGITQRFQYETILSAFGLGMLTTLIGLIGRMVLIQLFEKTDADTESAVEKISITAEGFSESLQKVNYRINNDMKQFAEEFKKTNTQITKATNKFSAQLEKSTSSIESLEKKMEDSITKFVSISEKKEADIIKFSESLERAGDAAASSLNKVSINADKLSDAMNKVDLSVFTKLNEEVREFSSNFSQTVKEIKSITASIKEMSKTFEPILKSQIELTTSSSKSFNTFVKNIEKIDSSLSEYVKSLDKQLDQFKKIDISFNTLDENLRKVSESASKFLGSSSESIELFAKNLTTVSVNLDKLNSVVSDVSSAFDGIKTNYAEVGPLAEEAEKLLTELISKQKDLTTNINLSQEMITKTQNALIESIRNISKEIS